jgi:hypothetical protein
MLAKKSLFFFSCVVLLLDNTNAAIFYPPSGGGGTGGLVTNIFTTNTSNSSITNIVQSMDFWTNDGAFFYQQGKGPNHPNGSAPGPPFVIKNDGSTFIGTNVAQDINETTPPQSAIVPFYQISFTDSNEPAHSLVNMGGGNNEASFNVFSEIQGTTFIDPTAPTTTWFMSAKGTSHSRFLNLETAISGSFIQYQVDGASKFNMNDSGDLSIIKGVNYSWPTTNATAGQLLTSDASGNLFWSSTNVITTASNAGATNIVLSIISNQTPNFIHGSTNYIAKFTPNTNEVGNSVVIESATNQWEWRSRPTGTSWTNDITNCWYAEFTDETHFSRLDLHSTSPDGSGYNELHGKSQNLNIAPLKLMDAWIFNSGVSTTPGNTAGYLQPATDNTYNIGTSSLRVRTEFAGALGYNATDATADNAANFGSDTYGMAMYSGGISLYKKSGGYAGHFVISGSGISFSGLALGSRALGFGATDDVTPGTTLQYGNALGTIQMGTNNAGAGAPQAYTLSGIIGSGSNKQGGDAIVAGGPSTGNVRAGNLRGQTTRAGGSGSSQNAAQDRLFISSAPVVLTESTATLVFNVALASGKYCGMRVMATTDADDGTNFQSVSETFSVAAVNKAGTVSTAISASAPTATVQSSGTLTTTWTAVANGNGVDIKCSAVSSLTQTTLNTQWRVELDGDGTLAVTAQ